MLWKLLGVFASIFTSPLRTPVDPQPFDATPYGPQNWAEAIRAHESFYGEGGDMRFPEEIEASNAGQKREFFKWPNNTAFYSCSPEIQKDKKMMKLIEDAKKMYHKYTCVRFQERTNEKDYVTIIKDPMQCYSYVGYMHTVQTMSLDDDCAYIGTVVHEIGHVFGLFHEHQRSDRDNYVTVNEKNIDPGSLKNFNKTEARKEETFGQKYDYTSIMHYGNCASSKDLPKCKKDKSQSMWTLVAKDGTNLLEPYDRPGLNQNDINLVNKLYKC